MCAVNPSRVSKAFSDAALQEVVDSIATLTGALLEIVNYNVEVRHILLRKLLYHNNQRSFRVSNMSALASWSLSRQ